jgi:hypothetical protein
MRRAARGAAHQGHLAGRYPLRHGDRRLRKKYRVSKNQLEAAWQPYIDAYPKTYDTTEHLISGMILPVWDRMHGQFVNVVQAVTDDGNRLIGRLIAHGRPSARRSRPSGSRQTAKMTPAQIRDAMLGGDQVELANGWILKKAVVSGEDRIEVVPSYMSRDEATAIKAYGGFVEVIQWTSQTAPSMPAARTTSRRSRSASYALLRRQEGDRW